MRMAALTHPKTKQLARRLGIKLPQTIGHLELLWAFVAQQTPRGDIGRWDNGVIADEAQWEGDPDEFINALIECRYLDESEEHRLLVHDWSEHMPSWVRAKLKNTKQEAIGPTIAATKESPKEPTTRVGKGREGKRTDKAPSGASSSATPPDCPHEEIIELYHELLPNLRVVREWNDVRRRMLKQRWRESTERQSLDWWRQFFAYVAKCDFLNGRVEGKDRKPFEADLEWLIRPTNFAKVVEGKYE